MFWRSIGQDPGILDHSPSLAPKEMCRMKTSLRLLLSRWLAKPSMHPDQHRAIDNSDFVESIQEPNHFPSGRSSRATAASVCTDSSVTEHCCSEEYTPKESEKKLRSLVNQRSRSIKRFLWDEPLGRPVPARNSIDSKLTAVESVCSRTPSDSAQLKLRSAHRSISPFALATFAADPHPIYSQPPQPPPTCPLPSLPVDLPASSSNNSPSPAQPSFSASAASLSSLSRGPKPALHLPPRQQYPSLPQLHSQASLQNVHPCISYRQAHQPAEDTFYDDDPFAAERIVVTGPRHRQASSGWPDDESVDPLGPVARHSRPNSVYTAASESCYSVNTTIDSGVVPSPFGGYVFATTPRTQGPPTSISTSGESQEGVITPSISGEDDELSQIGVPQLHRLTMTSPEVPSPKELHIVPSPPPLAETFSFGLPSRFDGFFFGYHRRPDPKYHAGPAMILKVSPPISSTAFSPGESIRFKITLANLFDHVIVSFVGESRLLGEHKIKSHRFLKHEVDLDSPGKYGCWEVQRGVDPKEWLVHLKIPSISNCNCKEKLDKNHFGELDIPSSTINNKIFIAYHLIIRGIGKQKKAEKPTKKKKKSKGEERVRLTVMVKKEKTPYPATLPEKVWVAGEHNYSCVSIE
ncbi:hypothetical protein PTTG_09622 [Puccinia triticina 1-1 BBBD Race 1]|uniref:Uncharacterized protein n=2 Tax=Puccinia triticina TaxID=208348 RepID=A0A180H456_PUCT1|nr:uncharacterized protein PtA15_2A390 [Puccinia triticina]OAV99591.1 hypothetical protein PTTG_09622 [Puccinia triticina 1-1 BBBD Race 1]WAQ82077.1 hypothetical protein PtA15_2A390 [Puccinia triticina]WAR52940.1 hypothetical protein PtB15_2B368 [Puccinia triticina]